MKEPSGWREKEESAYSDQVKRFVYQTQEEAFAGSLPRVLKPIPPKATVMGTSSPHQTGDLDSYEMLTRAPLYNLTCHFSDIPPNSPIRGAHRHISSPSLFCLSGKGWEWNDGETYLFEAYDLLVVPPYTIHQHGGDRDIGCRIYVPQARTTDALGLMHREQIKFGEKPTFPEGTEPMCGEKGELVGYRIKKGVLGITQDIEVYLGAEPNVEAAFQARRRLGPWEAPVENTYDRYLKLLHDEVDFCRKVTHAILYREQPWEWTPHGRLKWFVHPEISCAARRQWLYMQEIPVGSRSGKHLHMAEEQIFVLSGRGYDTHDGARLNWEKGDLINIPPMTEHQHFNTDAENPVMLFSSMPSLCTDLGLGGVEQLENAPEYLEKLR
jgi:quercetin dioxygenase-like cupin family protein